MNTQKNSNVQEFHSFSQKCRNRFLWACLKKFIWFLCECIINLLNGNLQFFKGRHAAKFDFRSAFRLLSPKRTNRKERTDLLASKKITALKKFYFSQNSFLLTRSSCFSFLLLHTKKVWKPSQFQSRNFQSVNLNKTRRTKFTHLRRRWKKNICQCRHFRRWKYCLFHVSSLEIRNL